MTTSIFYTMNCTAHFIHFNRVNWVAVQCETSGASEATLAVAEVSEATCKVLMI